MRVWNVSKLADLDAAAQGDPSWLLVYGTVDQPIEDVLAFFAQRFPEVPCFGATSFQGVFHPGGFSRGIFVLAGDREDGIPCAASLRASNAARARSDARTALEEIEARLGGAPEALLLHATPGFEERILESIDEVFEGEPPPLYGGSAADDDLSGKWRVFGGAQALGEGFVLSGFRSVKPIHGSFVAGYTPGTRRGRVTATSGRRIRSIDGRPAAQVYDEWVGGALTDLLAQGGNVLSRTTLHPLGRQVDKVGAVARYVLGHPHEVHTDGSLSLFAEMAVGDELVLMVGSEDALIERTDQVAARAGRHAERLRGGILVYCAGCVLAIGDQTGTVAHRFGDRVGSVPFVGAATFGEQGCFQGSRRQNRHGNLMCDAVLFE